jgi:hypothetical protein
VIAALLEKLPVREKRPDELNTVECTKADETEKAPEALTLRVAPKRFVALKVEVSVQEEVPLKASDCLKTRDAECILLLSKSSLGTKCNDKLKPPVSSKKPVASNREDPEKTPDLEMRLVGLNLLVLVNLRELLHELESENTRVWFNVPESDHDIVSENKSVLLNEVEREKRRVDPNVLEVEKAELPWKVWERLKLTERENMRVKVQSSVSSNK